MWQISSPKFDFSLCVCVCVCVCVCLNLKGFLFYGGQINDFFIHLFILAVLGFE
jgi:hypothetical protein